MKKVVGALIIATILLLCLAGLFIGTGHAATTSHKSNAVGFVQYETNPMTYKVGSVSVSGVPGNGIVFRLQPLGTFGLFTEDILICDRDAIAPLFENKHNPLVLTYKTQASRMIDGVGCHQLMRVDEMKTQDLK